MSLISAAARVFLASLAGGAGYASVKAGVWSDGKDSREKLDAVKERVSELRGEISYPFTEKKTKVSKVVLE